MEGTWHIHVRSLESGGEVSIIQSMRIGCRLWSSGSSWFASLHGACCMAFHRSMGVSGVENVELGEVESLGVKESEWNRAGRGLSKAGKLWEPAHRC